MASASRPNYLPQSTTQTLDAFIEHKRNSGSRASQGFGREHVRSSMSNFLGTPRGGRDPDGFVRRSNDEDCLKCMLRIPHRRCEAHKYIRVGGGYRHSFWYVTLILEEIEYQRRQEIIKRKRLEAIEERDVHAIKTYIRTKSGKLEERVIFVSDADYKHFVKQMESGKDPSSILKRYMTNEEAKGLESFDKNEQKAMKAMVRTKSGRLVEKLVYVSKAEYEAVKRGDVDAKDILQKHMKEEDGAKIEGWGEVKTKTIKTKVRTKSGRIIEKTVVVSEEDYQKMQQGGAAASEVLGKYMKLDDDTKLESWEKPKETAMKVVKTKIRTKSGRIVEKEVLLTEEEYKDFQKSGGDETFLRNFVKLKDGEKIEEWEKASTVFEASDDEAAIEAAKTGKEIVDKDGNIFTYVTDPVTGKTFKKKVGNIKDSDEQKMAYVTKDGKVITQKDVVKRQKMKAGKRNADSGSDYSYRSVHSAGGTRHVRRAKKNGDGTRDSESYHSSQDEGGEARRRRRRRERKHAGSAHSYHSVVSAGGTRHVRRRRRGGGGGAGDGDSESYHSADSAEFGAAARDIRERRKKARKAKAHGSASEHSYFSDTSVGGTKLRKRRKRVRDEHGNVIGYGKVQDYSSQSSDTDDDNADGNKKSRKGKGGKGARGKGGRKGKGDDSESDFSYFSEASAGGTRHKKKQIRIRDKQGRVIGHGKSEQYDPAKDRRKKRRGKDGRRIHDSDSDNSYFSEKSAGGTRTQKRRQKIKDASGKVIGYGKAEAYESSEDEPRSRRRKGKKQQLHGSDSEHSYYTDESKGGTKTRKKRQRIRDEHGRVVGYGKAQVYTSSDTEDSIVTVSDGKGGKMKVRNPKKGRPRKRKDSSDFTDSSTDSEIVEARLARMSSAEKKKYIAERQKRQEKRETVRKEKYGENYDKMKEKHKQKKEEYKSMVTYDKGGARFKSDDMDDRGIGLDHDKWGKKKERKRDGNEADSESEYSTEDEQGNKVKKKKRGGSGGSSVDIVRDEKGRVIKKIKRDRDGNVVETEYDKEGNVVSKKQTKGKPKEEDNGDYFDVDAEGKIKLKAGKKKIDITKISREDLLRLGINPNMTKAEIMRQLKEKLGDQVDVVFKGNKVGTKRYSECGSDVDTDHLADDSDIDLDTIKGPKRQHVILNRGGKALLEHMQRVLQDSRLTSDESAHPEERSSYIDFLAAYRLVDAKKLDHYVKAFIVEDADDMDGLINYRSSRNALKTVTSVGNMSDHHMDYVFMLLGIDVNSQLSFRMFAVIIALCERVTKMDNHCRDLLAISSLIDIERKLALYRAMFECNIKIDTDPNFIKVDSLQVELMAGGLTFDQQQFIIERMKPDDFNQISFLDYLCYIPLFLSFHDNIINNPLDRSNEKYTKKYRRKASAQRDMNPLGFQLSKTTTFFQSHDGDDPTEGKEINPTVIDKPRDNLNPYTIVPGIKPSSVPSSARKQQHSSKP